MTADGTQRLTVPRANEILDQQVIDLERLTEQIGATGTKVDLTREEVSRTAKEVSLSSALLGVVHIR
jgi:hypothetical protein